MDHIPANVGVAVRLATVGLPDRGLVAARVERDHLVILEAPGLTSLLADPDWAEIARAAGPTVPLDQPGLRWEAPVRPAKTFCVGLNFRTHIAETGKPVPSWPTLFGKWADTLTGPYDPVVLPAASNQVDWEIELGVVVGAELRGADPLSALAGVAGYTVVNDVSMRDWQGRTQQWHQGKNFEATTPVGPYLTTPDEVDDARDLEMICSVDGEIVQRSRTSDLLFGPAALLAYISMFTTLRPGDLIATGTPGGTGAAQAPSRFLRAGQVLESHIEGLGTLRNTFIGPQ